MTLRHALKLSHCSELLDKIQSEFLSHDQAMEAGSLSARALPQMRASGFITQLFQGQLVSQVR